MLLVYIYFFHFSSHMQHVIIYGWSSFRASARSSKKKISR
nr:MAG TPA: hypothetical protein [Inoviridae sp.]